MTVLNGQPEIFHSIQGEGRNLVKMSYSVRDMNAHLYVAGVIAHNLVLYMNKLTNTRMVLFTIEHRNQTQVSIDVIWLNL